MRQTNKQKSQQKTGKTRQLVRRWINADALAHVLRNEVRMERKREEENKYVLRVSLILLLFCCSYNMLLCL